MIKNLFEDRLELKPSTRLNSFSSLSSFLSPDPRPQTDPIGWFPLKVIYFGHFSSLLLASRAKNRPILYNINKICFNWAKYSFLPSYPPLPSQSKTNPNGCSPLKERIILVRSMSSRQRGQFGSDMKIIYFNPLPQTDQMEEKTFSGSLQRYIDSARVKIESSSKVFRSNQNDFFWNCF